MPGGSLDSQTSETQWYHAQFNNNEIDEDTLSISSIRSHEFSVSMVLTFSHTFLVSATISQHHLLEMHLLEHNSLPSPTATGTAIDHQPRSAPLSAPLSKPGRRAELEDVLHQEIQKCVYDLIVACGEAGKNGVQAAREELGVELELVKHELKAVTARCDLLYNELLQEHCWISVLEQTLHTNNVVFPDYPF